MIFLHPGKTLHSWEHTDAGPRVFVASVHTEFYLSFKNREQVTQELFPDLIGVIIKQALGAEHY